MNRRDAVIAVSLAAGLIALLVPSARVGVDFHHDGIMLKPALDVLSGQILFRDTFMQYGALTCYLHAVVLWFQPTLLSLRFLTVAAYGVSLFFLYAAWRLILPRSLAILSCGLFALFIPASEACWFELVPFWRLLPWSSVLAMMFQSMGLFALLKVIQGERADRWGLVLGATCAAAFWCRQPVGLMMFGCLVAIGGALHWAGWVPTRGTKSAVFVRMGAGFMAVNALFVTNIVAAGAFPEWWYQNFVWPGKWAAQATREIPEGLLALCVNPAAGLGLLFLLLAIATPAAVRRFRPHGTGLFGKVWWLGLAGLLWWQHEKVLAGLHLRTGGWTIFIPIVLLLQASRSLGQVFSGAGRGQTAEYYMVAALAAVTLGSLTQYFPVPDPWHVVWALAPGFGLFVFVCWRWVGLPAAVVALAFLAMFLPSVLVKVRWAQAAFARPLVTLEQPPLLRGMRVDPELARSIDQMAKAVDQILHYQPEIPGVMFGKDALLLCFMRNRDNPSPYFVTWSGLTGEADDALRWAYIKRVRPLLFLHKARWDVVNEFYRKERYVPLLYVALEALEIAVPAELAQAMGQSVYGMEPKKLETEKKASP